MSLMETAAMCDRALDGQDGGRLNQWDVYCLSVCPLVTQSLFDEDTHAMPATLPDFQDASVK